MNYFFKKTYPFLIIVLIYAFIIFQINLSISKRIYNLNFAKKITKSENIHFENNKLKDRYKVDSTSQKILLIGDSMSKWLRYRLQDYCEENNHKLSTVTWVSGNTKWFAKTDTINYYIDKYSASYVILVLGSNELFIKDISKNRTKFVDEISNKLSKVKWVWIGPPNWKKDSGINKMLMSKLTQDKFFLSENLKFQRQKDGMHPTVKSCSMWVDSIVNWINNTSRSRILLKTPTKERKLLKPEAIVLKPI
ncbi:MAG: hypothetical protein JXR51_07085 [Bacteroidales bacterium]|nr:hypothetical protein [Bacteroidales bacterium]MBN2756927.1 hypothetical protein [Bacteroidales bacterium]